jgi:hypothetical protein
MYTTDAFSIDLVRIDLSEAGGKSFGSKYNKHNLFQMRLNCPSFVRSVLLCLFVNQVQWTK